MTKSILLNGNAFGEVSEDALNELKTNLSAVQASSTHSTITGAILLIKQFLPLISFLKVLRLVIA